LAGYEDLNDAERLAADPVALRLVKSDLKFLKGLRNGEIK
jgi:hypothetical protein